MIDANFGFVARPTVMYECHCSQCGRVFDDGDGHTQWENPEHLHDWVTNVDENWQNRDGQWWCDDCILKEDLKDEQ